MNVNKNDPLPLLYCNFPYKYTRTKCGTVLNRYNDEYFLFGDDETQFIRNCNRAKQKGRSISDIISEYFY